VVSSHIYDVVHSYGSDTMNIIQAMCLMFWCLYSQYFKIMMWCDTDMPRSRLDLDVWINGIRWVMCSNKLYGQIISTNGAYCIICTIDIRAEDHMDSSS